MTDDLEVMGADAVVRERTVQAVEKTSIYEELERFLRGTVSGVQLESVLRRMAGRFTISDAHAAVLRASNDPELSELLYHTQDNVLDQFPCPSAGSLFLAQVYIKMRDPVIVYDLPLPFDGLGFPPARWHSDTLAALPGSVLVNTGLVGNAFGSTFPGVLINKGRCKTFTTPANLVVDLGTTDGFDRFSPPYFDSFFAPMSRDPCAYLRGGEHPAFRYQASSDYVQGHTAREGMVIQRGFFGALEIPFSPSPESESALRSCIDEVVGIADADPLKLFDRYGPVPGVAVVKELRAILDLNGGGV